MFFCFLEYTTNPSVLRDIEVPTVVVLATFCGKVKNTPSIRNAVQLRDISRWIVIPTRLHVPLVQKYELLHSRELMLFRWQMEQNSSDILPELT